MQVQYNGFNYFGWQRQSSSKTVQGTVESVFSQIADHRVTCYCSGRTDRGVHAIRQTVHFESVANRSLDNWLRGANSMLPNDISIQFIQVVSKDFHARFKANSRSYIYFIFNSRIRNSLTYQRASHISSELDLEAMQNSCPYFIGTHDFSSFRSSGCQAKSPIKTVKKLEIHKRENMIRIAIEADGFLYNMVRNIVAIFIEIGRGLKLPRQIPQIIAAKKREAAGITAEPNGLHFLEASYSDMYQFPRVNSNIWI